MRCLWITREVTAPETGGDLLYSGGLIHALAATGVELTVLCHARDELSTESPPTDVRWRIVGGPTRGAARGALSMLPNVAARYSTRELQLRLDDELRKSWDMVVVDHLGSGWALPRLTAYRRDHPCSQLVYVAHNHEASTRRSMADHEVDVVRARLLAYDARKAAALERRLVHAVDLVVAITDDDAARFASDAPSARVLTLSPGYSDRVVGQRTIDERVPRRVVVLGSFDWLAKRMNLEQLVEAADARFARAGVELLVVGRGPNDWIQTVQSRSAATRFTGPVPSVTDFLEGARVGLVAEPSGGGFKLKVLHYVFNRVPIAALDGSVAGVPLAPGDGMLGAAALTALTDTVLAAIDDLPALNELQERAFHRCAGAFGWASRGEALASALTPG